MKAPAAFRATVHSLRQVPSRKICQLVLELPIEETASVAAIAEHGAWVAIARLNPDAPKVGSFETKDNRVVEGDGRRVHPPLQPDAKPQHRWEVLPYPQQAGIRASDPIFWAFLQATFSRLCNSEETAAELIRAYCGVASRSLLSSRPQSEGGRRWAKLDLSFLAWKLADKVGALA